jgi:hypothetical protein
MQAAEHGRYPQQPEIGSSAKFVLYLVPLSLLCARFVRGTIVFHGHRRPPLLVGQYEIEMALRVEVDLTVRQVGRPF